MSNIYSELLDLLKSNDTASLITVLDLRAQTNTKRLAAGSVFFEDDAEMVKEAFQKGKPILRRENERIMIAEPFCKNERLIICGGGHVARAAAEFAAKTGFTVIVIDDRKEFADPGRFPFAKQVICDDFTHALPELKLHGMDYVVIATHDHRLDADCLRVLWKEPRTKYVGMIGSRRKAAGLKAQLEREGIAREWLDSICTPVGLSIGAVTPEEIGISILAELIQVKRMPQKAENEIQRSDVEIGTVEKLAFVPDRLKAMKKAVVTILESEGSCPRQAGAKMIVYEDGHTEGTIGGGPAEAEMTRIGGEILNEGSFRIEHFDLSHDAAAAEGMVCGGRMTLLIEAVPQQDRHTV